METSRTWSASGGVSQGMLVDVKMDRGSRSTHSGYLTPQPGVASQQRRLRNIAVSLPPRPIAPALSSGSSSSSSSGYTPLTTPTEEGSYLLGDANRGFPALFVTPGAVLEQGVLQQPVQCPGYALPIMPYPGRSFPLMTTSGEYYDETTLLPALSGGPHRMPYTANGHFAPHGMAGPSINVNAGAVWKDPSVPRLRPETGHVFWCELVGRE